MLHVRAVSTGVAGSPYYTNLYFTGQAGNAPAAATRVRQFFVAIAALMRTGLTTNVLSDVREIDPATGNTIVIGNGGEQAGVLSSGGANGLPFANQGMLRLITQGVVNNRRVIGRVFIPAPLVASVTTAGTPNGTYQSTLTTAGEALAGGPGVPRLVVWSRPTGGFPLGRAGSEHLVTSANAWDNFAVLRSRRD